MSCKLHNVPSQHQLGCLDTDLWRTQSRHNMALYSVRHKLLTAVTISSMSPWLIKFLICANLMDLGLYLLIWFACLALWVWAHPLFSKVFRVPSVVNFPFTPFACYPKVTHSLWYSLVPGLFLSDVRIMRINIRGAIFVSLMDHSSLPASDLCFHRTLPHSPAYQLPFYIWTSCVL